jgi:hypothetical protein
MRAARRAARWAEGLYVDGLTSSEKQEVVDAIASAILDEREKIARRIDRATDDLRRRQEHGHNYDDIGVRIKRLEQLSASIRS